MTRQEKQQVVADLQSQLGGASSFYIADSSELDVATVNKLRGLCHERNVEFKVVKNTLLIKALDALEQDYSPLYDILKGGSSVMLSETASAPAKLIKDFRKDEDQEKPILKGAYIDTDFFIGDEHLDELAKLKSKQDLLGEVITLLQSPMSNLVGALSSGGSNLAGIMKALEEKGSE